MPSCKDLTLWVDLILTIGQDVWIPRPIVGLSIKCRFGGGDMQRNCTFDPRKVGEPAKETLSLSKEAKIPHLAEIARKSAIVV